VTTEADPEEGAPIARVDRHILVVTPREPFAEWVRTLEEFKEIVDGDQRQGLEESLRMASTYLVPFSFNPDHVIAWVRENFEAVFATELNGVTESTESWPSDRTVEMFEDWFDLQLLDAPIDLVEGPFYLSELTEEEAAERVEELRGVTGGPDGSGGPDELTSPRMVE
jgi:hypothetical protein